jgi:methionine biosynthesis protein MetW
VENGPTIVSTSSNWLPSAIDRRADQVGDGGDHPRYARRVSPDPALAELYEAKAQTYASFGNGAIAAHAERLLPDGGRVLDVGCASGGLLALLRSRAGHLAGLELSASAATSAAQIADHVVQGAVEDPDLPFAENSFDLVVMADVLEHLADPAAALGRAVRWCRPGGAVLVSVPNVAHWQARLTLLRGRWPQADSGTFDAGHLRWFTRDALGELLSGAGLRDVELDAIVPALRNHAPAAAGPLVRRLEPAWQSLGRRAPRLFGYQVVGVGRR